MFGDLGGTWRSGPPSGDSPDRSCQVRFEGAQVTIECERLDEFTGPRRVVFDGGRASGMSDDGLEFAATRR